MDEHINSDDVITAKVLSPSMDDVYIERQLSHSHKGQMAPDFAQLFSRYNNEINKVLFYDMLIRIVYI